MIFMRLFLNFLIVLFTLQFSVEASSLTNTESLILELKSKIKEVYKEDDENILIQWDDEKLEKKISDLQKMYPKKNVEIKISSNSVKNILGKSLIPIDVYIDKKLNRTAFFKCKVDIYKNAVLSAINIRKGDNVTEEFFKLSKIPSSKLTKMHVTDLSALSGKTAAVDIKENSLITLNLFKEKILVFKGNQVTIRIVNGDLLLIGSGEALQDGYLGQVITVKVNNSKDKKLINAKVLEQSLVEVNLGGN